MFYTEWEILLVDDDPEVLHISRMAVQNIEVYGLPVKIHTAGSKADALAFLQERPDRAFLSIAVAVIDVRMENDRAGLELIEIIREEFQNISMQLLVYSGEQGAEDERSVVDRYDINGYLTKGAAAEEKLYALVKSGIRQYMSIDWLQKIKYFMHAIIQDAYSRRELEESISCWLMQYEQFRRILSPESVSRNDIIHALQINGRILFRSPCLNEAAASHRIGEIVQGQGRELSDGGDLYICESENHQCVKVSASESTPALVYYFSTMFLPPPNVIRDLHGALKEVGTIWQRVG